MTLRNDNLKITKNNSRLILPVVLSLIIIAQGIILINTNQNMGNVSSIPITMSNNLDTKEVAYEWLILNYIDGDNNLEENAIADMNELEYGYSGAPNLKILALIDRTPGYDTSNGDWTGTRLYEITHDTNTAIISSTLVKDFGELNMGAGSTLELLLEFGFNNYSADSVRIWLNLWDHGGGIDGICWDDSNFGDSLKMDEMQSAILNKELEYSRKIDLISHDACLMNMIEVANELKDLADYFVASEETVPLDGFDYASIMSFLSTNPTTSAENLAIELVNIYEDYYDLSTSYVTLSAINLSAMDKTIQYTNYFAANLTEVILDGQGSGINEAFFDTLTFYDDYIIDYKDFVLQILDNTTLTFEYPDLETSATLMLNEFDNLIIHNYQHSCYSGKAYGVSIFMPIMVGIYESYIDHYIYNEDLFLDLDWLTETVWDDFLDEFYSAGFGIFSDFTPLTLGIATGSISINEDDLHFYQITITTLAVYEISCFVANGNVDIYLYDTDFALFGHSLLWNPEDGNYEKIQTYIPVGIWVIIVNGFYDSTYNLVINQITIEEISIDGSKTATSGTEKGDDDSHYIQTYAHYYQISFTNDDIETYLIKIQYNSVVVDFDLYVLNTNFITIDSSKSTGSIDSVNFVVTSAITIIIEVYGYSGYGSFTLTVTIFTPTSSPSGFISGYTWIITVFSFLTMIGLTTIVTRKRNLH
ncbi:MAG: hypothetical protein JXA54_06165 [Candidatus Heimdallarchaeota archaeon]|nr:hypothetical protein [Candidatus Heimdallarchaeota archaeon]